MNKNLINKISFFFLGALFISACIGTQLPHVAPIQVEWAQSKWPEMDQSRFEAARTLYIQSCSGCHSLVPPKNLSLTEWEPMLNKMAPKAKISNEQKEIIWRYLVTVIAGPAEPKT